MNFEYLDANRIDELVGGVHTASQAQAIEMCLELLGSRTTDLLVAFPVNGTPDILAGIIRSGANPLLLDIDPNTLSFAPYALEIVLQSYQNVVVILPMLGGCHKYDNLSNLLENQIVIEVRKELPPRSVTLGMEVFSLYDFSQYLGGGAVVYSGYKKQLQDLAMIRDGVLGYHTKLPSIMYKSIENLIKSEARAHSSNIIRIYQENLFDKSVFVESECSSAFYVKVDNAYKSITKLKEANFPSVLASFPLYNLPDVAIRWQSEAKGSYPQAEALTSRIIALPTHYMIDESLAKKACEILNAP